MLRRISWLSTTRTPIFHDFSYLCNQSLDFSWNCWRVFQVDFFCLLKIQHRFTSKTPFPPTIPPQVCSIFIPSQLALTNRRAALGEGWCLLWLVPYPAVGGPFGAATHGAATVPTKAVDVLNSAAIHRQQTINIQ